MSVTRIIGAMSKKVLRKELSKSMKLKVENATMIPSLMYMYGCDVWSLTKQQQVRVQATQMSVLRRIQFINEQN